MAEVLRESGMDLDCSFIDGDFLYIFKRLENADVLTRNISQSNLKVYDQIRAWVASDIERLDELSAIAVFDIAGPSY